MADRSLQEDVIGRMSRRLPTLRKWMLTAAHGSCFVTKIATVVYRRLIQIALTHRYREQVTWIRRSSVGLAGSVKSAT